MTIDTLIMLTGAFVALLPFLGFPSTWDRVLLLAAGIFVVMLGIVVRRKGEQLYRTPLRASEENKHTRVTE